MKGWLNLLIVLFVMLLIVIMYHLNEREKAKQERKNLLEEKEQLLIRQRFREQLRYLLTKRYKWKLNTGYSLLLMSFAGFSFLFTLLFSLGEGFQAFLSGVAISEGALFIVTPYMFEKPCEFKYILTQFAPYLKKKIFGMDINIDTEIEQIKNKIVKIDDRILVLDKIIAA